MNVVEMSSVEIFRGGGEVVNICVGGLDGIVDTDGLLDGITGPSVVPSVSLHWFSHLSRHNYQILK